MTVSSVSSRISAGAFDQYARQLRDRCRQRRSDEAGSPAAEALQALQRQLAAIMRQMRQVRESNATAEQQARQLQDLNRQAFAIQGQIQKLLEEQLRLAQRLAAR